MMSRFLAVSAAAMFLIAGAAHAQSETTTKKKSKDKAVQPAGTDEPKKDAPDAKAPAPAAGTLKVGSDAPKISGETWVKGKEVKNFEKGTVYVIEFWATWCGPCLKSIPHLTEIQKKHKDLVVIGMASSEKGGTPEQREEKLSKFVKDQGSKMEYRVCYDSDSSMSTDWMRPAGQNGIPCAFVVNGEGKIAFVGHPMNEEFDKSIEKALEEAKAKPAKKEEKPKKSGFLMPSPDRVTTDFASQPPATDDDQKPMPKKDKAPKGGVLIVGSKAPELAIADDGWVQGDKVASFESGKVYVVEFWATWCPPCRDSIPHLSEMNTKFKDKGVTFIGVSDEPTTKVKPFVEKMGKKMNYTVVVDPKRIVSKAWMEAAKQGGIPTAFVVDKAGNIAWIGHPMDGLDKVIAKVTDGKYDPKKEAENSKKAAENGKKIAALKEELSDAFGNEEWDKMVKLADELLALDPALAKTVGTAKFNALLRGKMDYPAAYAYANKLVDGDLKDEPEALNEIAWYIVDEQGVVKRDFELAMRAATRAAEVTKFKNGMILDTLARVYFETGNVDKAIEWQTKAVEFTDRDNKQQIEDTLAKYKAAKAKK